MNILQISLNFKFSYMKNILILVGTLFLATFSFSQNNCNDAIDLGIVPSDAQCGPGGTSGLGSFTTPIGANTNTVDASNPYTYIPDCQGGTADMPLFAEDMWFSFEATATVLNVALTNIQGFSEVNVGFFTGSCAQLVGLGCQIGTGITGGDNFNAVLEPLNPGETYYVMVSGAAGEEGTYDISIANSLDCDDCLLGSTLDVSPAPVAGSYGGGEAVTFCYTVTEYEQVSSNWLHGITVDLGAGWTGAITGQTPNGNVSCEGGGDWDWYDNLATPQGSLSGFFFDGDFVTEGGTGDNNPVDNYGDFNAQDCDLEFCFTLVTDPCIAADTDLSVTISTWADGETGVWTSPACQNDAITTFNAILACCLPPNLTVVQPACPGDNGTITPSVLTSVAGDYTFIIYDENGDEVAIEVSGDLNDNSDDLSAGFNYVGATQSLPEGTYTVIVVDPLNCVGSEQTILIAPAAFNLNVPADIVVCENSTVPGSGFTNDGSGVTYAWTMTPDIGAGTGGNGQIGSFTATNPGAIATVTVTGTPDNSPCTVIETYTIEVTPAPVVTLTASAPCVNGTTPVVLTGTYTPIQDGVPVSFENGTNVPVAGSGNNPDIGTTSQATSSSITNFQTGILESICFTLSADQPGGIQYIAIEVNGVIYSSVAGSPAGAISDPSLVILAGQIAAVPGNGGGNDPQITQNFCVPQDFLNTIEATGGLVNTNWTFTTEYTLSGNEGADIFDFEVVINEIAPYDFVWSGNDITVGPTADETFGLPISITAVPTADETYTLCVTDDNNPGCTGCETIDILIDAAPTATPQVDSYQCITDVPAINPSIIDDEADNSAVVSVLFESETDTGAGTCPRTIVRTYRVTDDCGGFIDVTHTITVEDTQVPTATVAGALDVTLECSDAAGLAAAQLLAPSATDNCGLDLSTLTEVSGGLVGICPEEGTYTNTWTIEDDCGNVSAVYTQVITIEDTEVPTWTTVAGALDVTLECSDAAGITAAQAAFPVAADNCDADVTNIVEVAGAFVAGACPEEGTYTNTWTVTDCAGNVSAVYTQVITIEDTEVPTWTTVAGALDASFECSDVSGLAAAQALSPIAADNCDADVTNIVEVVGALVPRCLSRRRYLYKHMDSYRLRWKCKCSLYASNYY